MSLQSLLKRFKAVLNSKPSRALPQIPGQFPRTQARTYDYFANRGPAFEPPQVTLSDNQKEVSAQAVAFYLPQFHRFPENDQWWGNGFTEWHNVARGAPRYQGHYQPRIPADLGYYDLNDRTVLENQAKLAKDSGISAFCFYYYWFNGKRLMEKPIDLFADGDMPIDFCLMWANENWTRTWDGLDNEVLIQQDYRKEDEAAFIQDTARYMANSKYLTIDGRPLFIIYRASLLPDAYDTLKRWRGLWTEQLGVEPWLLMAQSFDETDPRPYGLDGAVEFPPHKIGKGLGNLRKQVKLFDQDFTGLIRDYNSVVDHSLGLPVPEYLEIKTVSPSWDNDARRQSRATSFYGATPVAFQRWMEGAVKHAIQNPFNNQPLVFINAWNEWAEGAYLEPDVHYGHAMLNVVKRALVTTVGGGGNPSILLLGHDAHRHGAQILLLHLAKAYKEYFKIDVCIVLQQGGTLVREYQQYARTTVLGEELLPDHLQRYGTPLESFQAVIANTTVSGNQLPSIQQANVASISLIHELPDIIQDYGLQAHVQEIAECSEHVVFAADMVKVGFESFGTKIKGKSYILPQGSYMSVQFDEQVRQRFRNSLAIDESDKLIINVGFADSRKGFDLFLETAEQGVAQNPHWHFAWVGKLHSDMQTLASKAFKNKQLASRVHLIGFVAENTDHYSACDAFFLSSREDPYPSVVLEALEAGVPFVVYENCTGLSELAKQFGATVPYARTSDTISTLEQLMRDDNPSVRSERTDYVRSQCQFNQYCETLLNYADVKLG